MTLKEYLEALQKAKKAAEGRFNNMSGFQQQLVDSSFSWLLTNLSLKQGAFEVPGNLTSLMNSFVDNLLTVATKNKSFEGAVTNYIHDIETISGNVQEFHAGYNEIIAKTKGLKDIQKTVVNEIIDQYTGNGLNTNFAQPLRELMFGNLLGGMTQQEAKQYLKEYIIGGQDQSGKLHRYLEQTAQQGVDSYTGAVNMKLKSEFGFTGYVISGSIIDNSSKQCIYAIETSDGGYLSFSDWEKVLQLARDNKKAALIEGTTIDNLPLNKLHWGCRHEFTPIVKKGDPVVAPKQQPEQEKKPAPEQKPTPKPKTTPKQAPKPKVEPTPTPKAKEPEDKLAFVPAKTIKEAEHFALNTIGVKYVNFKGIHIDIVNDINKSVLNIKKVMPEIRTTGIGSAQQANKDLKEIIAEAYKKGTFYASLVKGYGQKMADKYANKYANGSVSKLGIGTIAWSQTKTVIRIPGGETIDVSKFAGVFVNEKYGKDARSMNEMVVKNSLTKWFTKGAKDFGYIMTHELGHEIDKTIGFKNIPEFKAIYDREHKLGIDHVSERLSVYGATAGGKAAHKPDEMIAESWAEYMTSPTPRALAIEVGELMLKTYYEKYVQGTGTTFKIWKEEVIKLKEL